MEDSWENMLADIGFQRILSQRPSEEGIIEVKKRACMNGDSTGFYLTLCLKY